MTAARRIALEIGVDEDGRVVDLRCAGLGPKGLERLRRGATFSLQSVADVASRMLREEGED